MQQALLGGTTLAVTDLFAPMPFTFGAIEIDLEAADAHERLIAMRDHSDSTAWRDAAITLCAQLADRGRDDEAQALFAAFVASVEPARAIELLSSFVERVGEAPKLVTAAWREALAAAAPGSADEVEVAAKLVRALADDLEKEQIPAVIDSVIAHAAQPFAAHRRFASELGRAYERELAFEQTRRAVATAPDRCTRLDVLIELVKMLRDEAKLDERAQLVGELEALAAELVDAVPRATIVRAYLELAEVEPYSRPPQPRIRSHLERAAALATELTDLELRHAATSALANELFRAGDFTRAESTLAALPGLDDDHLSTVGFLEQVRRKLGMVGEPPAEAFVQPPRETSPLGDVFAFFGDPALPEGAVAYFTHGDPLAMIRENRLAPTDIVRMWSHGAVACAADLDSEGIFGPVRSFACTCGRYLGAKFHGFVCECCSVEVIANSSRAVRFGHISLASAVVHPWYVGALATLLGLTQTAIRRLDPSELHDQLAVIDPITLAIELRDKYNLSKSDRSRLDVLEAIESSRFEPRSFQLELIPVWPPDAQLPDGVDRAKMRAAYAAIVESDDPTRAVAALFACFASCSANA